MIGIYKITSPTGKIYIGQSKDIELRFKFYKNLRCKTQTKLYNSFLKHGVEKHLFEIICNCCIEDLNEFERYYQEIYNCIGKNGLNLILTSSLNSKRKISEETRLKMIASSTGKNNYNFMRPRTDSTKLKISLSNKGVKRSKETRLKMSLSKIGRKPSDETKRKMSETSKRNNYKGKIVLDLNSGVFYNSIIEVSNLYKLNKSIFYDMLNGVRENKTSFVCV